MVNNPLACTDQRDLSGLFDNGAQLGRTLTTRMMNPLEVAATCYGKASVVGQLGAMEHGTVVQHLVLGEPERAAIRRGH